jgi:hypothetical protein
METASPSKSSTSSGLVGRKFTVWLNATTPKHHGTVVAQIQEGVYLVEIDDTKVQHLVSLAAMMTTVERGPSSWEFS